MGIIPLFHAVFGCSADNLSRQMQAREHAQVRVRAHTVWLSGEKLMFHTLGHCRSDPCVQHFSTPCFSSSSRSLSYRHVSYFLLSLFSHQICFSSFYFLPCHGSLIISALYIFYIQTSFIPIALTSLLRDCICLNCSFPYAHPAQVRSALVSLFVFVSLIYFKYQNHPSEQVKQM